MQLWILISGSIGMAMLGFIGFLMSVFAGSAAGNNHNLRQLQFSLLTTFLYLLPGICIVAIVMVWRAWSADLSTTHYWWFAMPLPFYIAYILYISGFEQGWR